MLSSNAFLCDILCKIAFKMLSSNAAYLCDLPCKKLRSKCFPLMLNYYVIYYVNFALKMLSSTL